jgi:hypothetical protein
MSPRWQPGKQGYKPVRVAYAVPISFKIDKSSVFLKDLRNSNYGFVFNIKGTLYTIEEVKTIIGNTFKSADVQIAVPFFNYNKVPKFDIPNKKGVYLLIFKPKKS